VYDYITKLNMTWTEVILNHVNPSVIGEGQVMHRKYKRLKLGDGQTYGRSADDCSFRLIK
jgi:hypothetical protein